MRERALGLSKEPAHGPSTQYVTSTEGVPSFSDELIVTLTQEEQEVQEVQCLQVFSILCRVIGSKPNRKDLRDMMYGAMQDRVGKIVDVQILGRGFYHVEFAEVESVMALLQLKLMDVRGSRVVFSA